MPILKGSATYLHDVEHRPKDALNYLMMNFPFECNYRCNIKCCNLGGSSPLQPISLQDRKGYLERGRELGVRVLVFAGEGEPTMHEDFRSLVQFASSIGLIPYIFTNGSLIDKSLAGFLARCGASLIINVDFFRPEKYDAHVNLPGAFKTVMSNLAEMRAIYQQRVYTVGDQTVVSLAMNMVLNNENGDQVDNLTKFCGDDIVPVLNQPIKIGAAAKHWGKFDEVCNYPNRDDVSRPLGTLSQGEECSYLRNGVSFGADGRMLTCAYALNSAGAYGDYRVDITLTRQQVLDSVDAFYKEFGSTRCILRHPQYPEFIARLKRSNSIK